MCQVVGIIPMALLPSASLPLLWKVDTTTWDRGMVAWADCPLKCEFSTTAQGKRRGFFSQEICLWEGSFQRYATRHPHTYPSAGCSEETEPKKGHGVAFHQQGR